MNTIDISAIVIPENRIRRDFDPADLQNLADDIASVGLIHLPVLRSSNKLVSGERRLRAMKMLHDKDTPFSYMGEPVPKNSIPFAHYESLPEQVAREIELSENIMRVDLPWQIVAQATAELHELKTEQNPDWTIKDTTKIAGYASNSRSMVQRRIVLAANLSRPEVRAAKTEIEAVKILSTGILRELETEQRKRQDRKQTRHTLVHGNSIQWMRDTDTQFDVICTDAPYGLNADKFGVNVRDNMNTHHYTDSEEEARRLYDDLAILSYKVTKTQAHLYLFHTIEYWPYLSELFASVGWIVWPRPLIWYKHTGNLPKPDLGPRYVYECILFANKGHRPTTGLYPDVIDCQAVKNKKHAAEKPIEVIANLLRRSMSPGDTVLDPFCGSGPVFSAANMSGVTATGIDISRECIDLSQERLNELV